MPKAQTNKLDDVKFLVTSMKRKLKHAPMVENLGQKEVRRLNDFIGGDLYERNAMGELVYAPIIAEFDSFVEAL